MSVSYLIQHVIDALTSGSLYAIYALGIAIVFSVMGLINFAHGELIMIAGFTVVLLADAPLPVALAAAVLLAIAFAMGMERIAFRPVRGASATTLLVTSFAVSYFLQNLAGVLFGNVPLGINILPVLSQAMTIGSVSVPYLSTVVITTTFITLAALSLFLSRSNVGLQLRAAAEDFTTARLLGVRANSIIALAFAISGLLAGLGALFEVAQTGIVYPTMGANALLFAFVATILGGMGSLSGAVLGGYVLGSATVVLQVVLPAEWRPFRDALIFGLVIVVLLARPQGLIGSRSRAGRV